MINKKRINNCNQLTKSTFKGANDYDKQNYFNKEKEKTNYKWQKNWQCQKILSINVLNI